MELTDSLFALDVYTDNQKIILKQYDEHLEKEIEVFISPKQAEIVCELILEAKQKLNPSKQQLFSKDVMFTKKDDGTSEITNVPSFDNLQPVTGSSEETIVLTEELIRAGMTGGIGINKLQQEVLGISFLGKGWLQKLIGETISKKKYDKFVALKGATSK